MRLLPETVLGELDSDRAIQPQVQIRESHSRQELPAEDLYVSFAARARAVAQPFGYTDKKQQAAEGQPHECDDESEPDGVGLCTRGIEAAEHGEVFRLARSGFIAGLNLAPRV